MCAHATHAPMLAPTFPRAQACFSSPAFQLKSANASSDVVYNFLQHSGTNALTLDIDQFRETTCDTFAQAIYDGCLAAWSSSESGEMDSEQLREMAGDALAQAINQS